MIKIQERILQVLDKTHLMSLAVSDENGPWVADLIFIHDKNLNVYWMSDPKTRHSMAILKNHRVAASITASTKSKEPNFGGQIEGVAAQLKGIQFDLLIKHLAKRGYQKPKLSEAKKILDGDLWYKLKTFKIGLIDEENFGYERQDLILGQQQTSSNSIG